MRRARAAKDAGVQSVSVSIDGRQETHDAVRGVKGSHRAAFEAMANLREVGLQVAANTQIGRYNLREIPEVFDDLVAAGIRPLSPRARVSQEISLHEG